MRNRSLERVEQNENLFIVQLNTRVADEPDKWDHYKESKDTLV